MFLFRIFVFSILVIQFGTPRLLQSRRSFEISANGFLKDGEPFQYISGTIHYFRVHPDYWRDRLRKLRYAGCNVVQTYIEWSSHEPEPGEYNFDGANDIMNFLNIAFEEDLLVILRPGPFIDAERDMGGFPYWLLRENPSMELRTSDESYLFYVDRWFNVLLPLLSPFLYENDGPVIMMQVENEYGSYSACDFYYTSHLRDLIRSILGDQLVLFTTDGRTTSYLKCGKVADVYATVDFGPEMDVTTSFAAQRVFEPEGPLINSEFYPGWLDHWGDPHSTKPIEEITRTLDEMLALNASVNIYVFHGGTSFGMKSGSNLGSRFQACPTSYDYDAPLNEAGDPTEKYFAIRNITQKYLPLPSGEVPGPSPKAAYGDVQLTLSAGILELKEVLDTVISDWPQTFEALSVSNGIVIYSTKIPYMIPDPARLTVLGLHDRGYVFIDEELAGIASREQSLYEIPIFGKPNQTLSIVVESQGRICVGDGINDFKGLTMNATIGLQKLSGWSMTALPLLNSTKLQASIDLLHQKNLRNVRETLHGRMAIYNGILDITDTPEDTFLRLDGWTKGYAWVNGFLLGRYWPVVGPQITLYIPKGLLKTGDNAFLVLELEKAPCAETTTCKISLVDIPEIDGPTPEW